MPSVQVLSDTTFASRAAEAVDALVRENGCPVKHSQISGLRQIAINQPARVKEFAGHQLTRAEKRESNASAVTKEKFQNEIAFWKLVANLCAGKAPRCQWSLNQEAEQALPNDLKDATVPDGGKLTRDEQQRRSTTKKQRNDWLADWVARHYPAFFQHFCAHYLYCLGKQEH